MTQCQFLAASAGASDLFRPGLCFDWYDGPQSGLVACNCCRRAFYFELLDWEDPYEKRVFGYYKRDSERVEHLVEDLAAGEDVPEPFWLPQDDTGLIRVEDWSPTPDELPLLVLATSRYMTDVLGVYRVDSSDRASEFIPWSRKPDDAAEGEWLRRLLP